MRRRAIDSAELAHVGAGTTILLSYAALIPGVVPTLALTALIILVVLAPAIVLGLVGALIVGPPLLFWRLATRGRRRGTRRPQQTGTQ
jgi:hypothetical protein